MEDNRDSSPNSSGATTSQSRLSSHSSWSPASPGKHVTDIEESSSTPEIPDNLTQAIVDANPVLKRFQQDLLILASFNENETIHWRPSWFKQGQYGKQFWTLYNPPNVVTEKLPNKHLGRLVYTRRMKQHTDSAENPYIQTWDHWELICELRGIPKDFLCEKQVELIQLGRPRDKRGRLCAPPTYPLYPEPQPAGQGRYILDTSMYNVHLPAKFHNLRVEAPDIEDRQVVVVHSNGALKIENRFPLFMHSSQWTHFNGEGAYEADGIAPPDLDVPKEQGKGRKWSYLPWTKEMEESCLLEERVVSDPRASSKKDVLRTKSKAWDQTGQDEQGRRKSKRLASVSK